MKTETFIREKLSHLQQTALIEKLPLLKSEQLATDLDLIDEALFARQVATFKASLETSLTPLPLRDYSERGSSTQVALGEKLLSEGKCGALVVAGGQGSRLRYHGPKGCMPISLVKQKSTFALLAEKTRAASKKYGCSLPLAIMTSPENHGEINVFFAQHGYFGCDPHQITFFIQPFWPLLDDNGDLFLQSEERLAMGPNGNGAALSEFCKAGGLNKWRASGVEMIHFLQIDNPLADPFDAELFGLCHDKHAEVAINAVWRRECSKQVGVLIENEGCVQVVEYTELPETVQDNIEDYPLANASLFCFTLDFVEKAASYPMPMHRAKKGAKMLGMKERPKEPNAWKFENYIFDVLPLSNKTEVLVSNRRRCFAPLKNYEGEDSMQTVQAALLESDKETFAAISGHRPPEGALFELAQEFYYPTEELKKRWKGKALPKSPYLEEN